MTNVKIPPYHEKCYTYYPSERISRISFKPKDPHTVKINQKPVNPNPCNDLMKRVLIGKIWYTGVDKETLLKILKCQK